MKNILLLNVFFIFLFFACKKDDIKVSMEQEQKDEFVKQSVPGVYDGSVVLVMYQEDIHQIAYTNDGKNWRIQNDDLSVYVACGFDDGLAVDKNVIVTIKAKGIEGISNGSQSGIVLKVENKKCWLWLTDSNIGILTEMK